METSTCENKVGEGRRVLVMTDQFLSDNDSSNDVAATKKLSHKAAARTWRGDNKGDYDCGSNRATRRTLPIKLPALAEPSGERNVRTVDPDDREPATRIVLNLPRPSSITLTKR